MIFYHFTTPVNLPSILCEGLKLSTNYNSLPPYDCIWLTTDPARRFRTDGSQPAAARIELLIPTSDRRLKKWTQWLRKYDVVQFDGGMVDVSSLLASLDSQGLPEYKVDWVYFAPLPPARFRNITHIPEWAAS
jgi:hypothetical protein